MNVDWSHLGDCLKCPRRRDDGSDGYARISGLGHVRTRAVGRFDALDGLNEMPFYRFDALDWLDKNRLAELTSLERFTLCEM